MKASTRRAIEAVDINDDNYQYIVDGIKILAKNGYEIGEYNPHGVSAWLIQNDHTVAVAIGGYEQEAIDNTVDAGAWDSLMMSEADHIEYTENGWDDSFCYAGNACEAFWCEHLHITKLIQA